MKTSKQREIEDPKNWPYAYGYDAQGYSTGMFHVQKDQLESEAQGIDVYLLPANSTRVRPPMKEGFRPKWNGEVWTLVPREVADAKVEVLKQSIEEVKESLFTQAVAQVTAQVQSSMQLEIHKFLKQFSVDQKMFVENLRSEIRTQVENKIAQLYGPFSRAVADMETELKNKLAAVELYHSESQAILSEMRDLNADAQERQKYIIENSGNKIEVIEKPGLIARLFTSDSNKSGTSGA